MVIYKTINLINGISYIGKDSKNQKTYLGSGLILKRAIKKYGKENFKKEILETCLNLEELNKREIFWIAELDAVNSDLYYNIMEGGKGGDTLSNHPDIVEIKKRISLGTSIAQMGRTLSTETKNKISESNKKVKKNPMRDETKKKISEKLKLYYKNNKHHYLGMTKETNISIKITSEKLKGRPPWNKGKHMSDEARKNMSESAKGRIPWNKGKKYKLK